MHRRSETGVCISDPLIISKGSTLTLQETRSIYDSTKRPKIEFITYIYIFIISHLSILPNLAGFPHTLRFRISQNAKFPRLKS